MESTLPGITTQSSAADSGKKSRTIRRYIQEDSEWGLPLHILLLSSSRLTRQGRAALPKRGYLSDLRDFAAWVQQTCGEPFDPARIVREDVRAYIAHLRTVKRQKPATVNRKLTALKAFCRWAAGSGLLEGNPTIGDGLRIASRHIGAILVFSFFSGTVGMILRILARGGKGLGRMGAAISGLAWNLVTYLVLPVLVVEEINPIDAIIRSATLLKKTWGEQIVVNLSTDAVFGLPKLLVIGLIVLVVMQGVPTESPVAFALVIALLVIVFLLLGLIESTLKGIYVAAVYRYSAQGEAGGFFSEEVVKGAFKPK